MEWVDAIQGPAQRNYRGLCKRHEIREFSRSNSFQLRTCTYYSRCLFRQHGSVKIRPSFTSFFLCASFPGYWARVSACSRPGGMKLSLPRVAARRGLGGKFENYRTSTTALTGLPILSGSLCPLIFNERPWCSLSPPQSRPLPSYQPSHRSRRHQSNPARATHPENINQASTPKQSSKPPSASSLSEHVRLLMRRVPYPVAIITATDPSGPADITSFRGMTVSSFNTVTLTPHPVVSFNVRRPSETLNALLASGRFLIHLLAPGPGPATLARDFSKGNTNLAAVLSGHGEFEYAALSSSSATWASDGKPSDGPLPILRRKADGRSDDFPFVFECALHPQKIDVHDHSIVLGTVVRAIEGTGALLPERTCAGEAVEHSSDRLCLTYANTKFWRMGTEI